MRKKIIFTIGHSTHTTREFMKTLKTYEVDVLVDVRHFPGSRYCPQFGKARLRKNLLRNGIDYVHLVSLGGRRRPDKLEDKNLGWRSPQFRGYADYMQTQEFKDGLKELMDITKKSQVVIMCSEAVPWRCHRSMIGDALLVHGYEVVDIFTQSNSRHHKMTPFAKVSSKNVTYPAQMASVR